MKVLVIGSGAIGSYYGSLLAREGVEVSMIARSDYETVKEFGIDIEGKEGVYHFRPARVLQNANQLAEKSDYLLLCVKVVEGVDRVGLLRNAVGPNTSIVLISNGIDIEQAIVEAFPHNEVVSALAFICVTRTAPGKIWHQAYGRIALGNFPTGLSEKTRALGAVFEKSGVGCIASENITTARWQKCVWNAAFNPLSVLSGGLSTADILNSQETFVRSIMEEVAAIANAAGHPLPDDIVDLNIAGTHKMPPYKTSMLLDFEAGRPMETEAILGNAVRHGWRLGVPIPHLESIYALIRLREIKRERDG